MFFSYISANKELKVLFTVTDKKVHHLLIHKSKMKQGSLKCE